MRERDAMPSVKFATSFKIGLLDKRDWRAENRCRMFLKVLSIVDIADGCGEELDTSLLHGRRQQRGKIRLLT